MNALVVALFIGAFDGWCFAEVRGLLVGFSNVGLGFDFLLRTSCDLGWLVSCGLYV